MDWSKGYSASYYMTIVDPLTWRDIERIEIEGGQIKRTTSGLMESASLDCARFPEGIEKWVRIWFDADQVGSSEHLPLFTGIATSPADDYDGARSKSSLECYSVLKAASDINLLRGWYAPAGMEGAAVIKQLLSTTPAPVEIAEGSPRLSSHIIAEDDETRLTMIEKILMAIDWRLRINGDGSITVEPKNTDPVIKFDPVDFDVIENSISVKADWFSCPNVFMAVEEDLTAIARDDSEKSKLSTVNRGREVWLQETGCELAANETIEQYAIRRLKESQKIFKTASYKRRYLPNVYPGDYIRMNYPKQDLNGVFQVSNQSIDLGYAAQTTEEIMTEVE